MSILLAILALGAPQTPIAFVKTVLDTRFIAEGVAAADVNRDGKLDILAGDVWFEAPNWTPREIAPVQTLDPKRGYSNCFHNWAEDVNRDGWIDQILIGPPGERAVWRENPKGAGGPWKEHLIWRSAGNESPWYTDLFRDGKRVLVMAYDDNYVGWFEPAADPYAEWVPHHVSGLKGAGSQRYSHGLGVGDVDGDGRKEILTTGGTYAGTREGPWTFTKAEMGPDCAHMIALDVNGDARPDVLSTAAHARGVWWFEHGTDGRFTRREIDAEIAGTHAAVLATIGGVPNLITGKRKWAHSPGVDPGSDEASLLVRYALRDGTWARYVIDDVSGVGTQFEVRDMNGDGLLDIVTANKNGVFLFVQDP